MSVKIFWFSQLDSTNEEAKRRAKTENLHKCIFVAETQTSGRGRIEREFFSVEKSNLYMSYVFCPTRPVKNPALFTIVAATATSKSIEKIFHVKPKIKWVNDLLLNEKKICGILTEGILKDEKISQVIVGIGINLTAKNFPKDLQAIATGIIDEKKNPPKKILVLKNRLLKVLAKNLTQTFLQVDKNLKHGFQTIPKKILFEYRKRSNLLGKKILVHPVALAKKSDSPSYKARAIAIDENGNLKIRTEEGTEKILIAGEVSLN